MVHVDIIYLACKGQNYATIGIFETGSINILKQFLYVLINNTKMWIFWPISQFLHHWPQIFISFFKNEGIITLINTMFIESLIPEQILLLVKFSMSKIRHFLSLKRSFENLQGMIWRIFLIIRFYFHYFS